MTTSKEPGLVSCPTCGKIVFPSSLIECPVHKRAWTCEEDACECPVCAQEDLDAVCKGNCLI